MNVGLVARADDRGIGTMTWEFHDNMRPAKTLVVREPGAERKGFRPHFERYPGASVAWFDPDRGELPEAIVRDFLDGLDVVYLVETPYDWRFFSWAREARVATVLHVMPEFFRWHDISLTRPDVWWLPTSWRADQLPDEARVVPVPVPTAPHWLPSPPTAAKFVHVVGHRAAMDRNGTTSLIRALRFARGRFTVRIEAQDARLPCFEDQRVAAWHGGREDRWTMYVEAAALVMPRRYGGLCLPVLEAMACGLAVVMPDVEPNSEWPIVKVRAREATSIRTPGGGVPLHDTDPRDLARVLDRLVDPDEMAAAQSMSRAWAAANSWDALRGMYESELTAAVGCRA